MKRILSSVCLIFSFLLIGSVSAVTVDAGDLWDAAVAAGHVSGSPAVTTLYNIGNDLVVGNATFHGVANNGTTAYAMSYYETSTAGGVGVHESAGPSNAQRNIYGGQRIDVNFTSAVAITELKIGRWGSSDGSFKISGFSSDPGASAENFNYSDVSQGSVSTSYSSGTVTVNAVGVFGYAVISFTNAGGLTGISLKQSSSSNDGMCFHSITYSSTGAPLITEQPADVLVEPNLPAQFTIGAASDSNITYNWYKTENETTDPNNDTLVQSSDSNSYSITSCQVSDEAFYYCVLDNDAAEDTVSELAALGVKRMLTHWKLDAADYNSAGYYVDSSSEDNVDHNAIPIGVPSFVDGVEPNISNEGAVIDSNGAATAGTWDPSKYSNQLTVNGWVYLDSIGSEQTVVCKTEPNDLTDDRWGFMVADDAKLTLEAYGQTSVVGDAIGAGEWVMVTAAFDGTDGKIYINGILSAQGSFALSDGKEATVQIGNCSNTLLDGVLDDIRIYNYAVSSSDVVQLHYNTSGNGVCDPANTIQFDVAGANGTEPDCRVNIYDMQVFASEWMQ